MPEAILITHCHFDHVGAVAEMARATKAPVYCPAGEVLILENINDYAFPGFGPFETYTPEHTVKGGDTAAARRLHDRRDLHARPQPGPRDVLDRRREGDLLRRRALPEQHRPHRPAGRRPRDADALDRHAAGHAARGHRRAARPHGADDARRGSARATRSCASSPRGEDPGAARHVRRAARTSRTSAAGSRRRRRRSSNKAGYGRIETPTFEATELFSRTVGEATDVVQKEMYTFPDGSGDSLTLRPEGTAPVVRAYLEHGMHKAAAAGEALVPLELLPLRAPAGRPLPPVLADRRRGDRLARTRPSTPR